MSRYCKPKAQGRSRLIVFRTPLVKKPPRAVLTTGPLGDCFNYYTFGFDRYPHNLVLEMAQAGGMVAVLLLLAWIVHVMLSSWHGRNHYTEIGLSMTALIFGCALFSGDFYDSRLMFIFGVLTISSAEIEASREHEDRALV